MPKCGSCSIVYEDPAALELVRNQDNRWVAICRKCLEHGVDARALTPPPVAVEESAIRSVDQPAIDVTAVPGDLTRSLHKLVASLRALRKNAEKVGRARAHERHGMEMTVNFILARDDASHEGLVKDISQGGIRIVTKRSLTKGQVIQFDWNMPLPPAAAKLLQSTAEVRRVVPSENGAYDVGLRFVKRQLGKGVNRRRFRRYKCDMIMYYLRERSEIMSRGMAKDISQGGSQIYLDEKLEIGETLTVRLAGGAGTKGDLTGTMRVCRVLTRGMEFEIGCSFVQMRMEKGFDSPLAAGADGRKGGGASSATS